MIGNIMLIFCFCGLLFCFLGFIKTTAAGNAFETLIQIVEAMPVYEDKVMAIDLFSTNYAYSWRVQINPFTWGPKTFHPKLVEFLESKGIEVK